VIVMLAVGFRRNDGRKKEKKHIRGERVLTRRGDSKLSLFGKRWRRKRKLRKKTTRESSH